MAKKPRHKVVVYESRNEMPNQWEYSVFKLEKRMLELGVTWHQVCVQAKISSPLRPVKRYRKNGKIIVETTSFSVPTWKKLAKCLGVPLTYFIDRV